MRMSHKQTHTHWHTHTSQHKILHLQNLGCPFKEARLYSFFVKTYCTNCCLWTSAYVQRLKTHKPHTSHSAKGTLSQAKLIQVCQATLVLLLLCCLMPLIQNQIHWWGLKVYGSLMPLNQSQVKADTSQYHHRWALEWPPSAIQVQQQEGCLHTKDDGVGPSVGSSLTLFHVTFLVGALSQPLGWVGWLGVHTGLFLPVCIAFEHAMEMEWKGKKSQLNHSCAACIQTLKCSKQFWKHAPNSEMFKSNIWKCSQQFSKQLRNNVAILVCLLMLDTYLITWLKNPI